MKFAIARTRLRAGFAVFFSLILLAGCSGGSSPDAPQAVGESVTPDAPELAPFRVSNSAPVARIGGQYETLLARLGETIYLNGSPSYDPDGDALTYEWTFTNIPQGSGTTLSDSAAPKPEFVPDMVGDYTVQLIVSDHELYSEPAYLTVTAIEHLPVSLNWGLEAQTDTGEDPGIAINNHGVIVEVHESPSLSNLWYRVGVINGGLVDWGGSHKYDTGLTPSVDINDDGVVVEIHRSEVCVPGISGCGLWYHVGLVDPVTKTIDFGSSRKLDSGRWPSIAINNHGHVIEVHGSEVCIHGVLGVIGCGLWYHVGEVDLPARRILFGGSHKYDSGKVPGVDINDAGQLVEVHKSENYDDLWYWTGRLNVGSRTFTKLEHGKYETGKAPDVALSNNGRVVEVHESESTKTLWSAVGHLSEDDKLTLGKPAPYNWGARPEIAPAVAINDRDEFVAMHEIGDASFLPTSNLLYLQTRDFAAGKNTDRWMELTRTMHRKTLKQIMLPGTHDSAAYKLYTELGGDPVNARGPDWKGLERACDFIADGWLGDWLIDRCEALLPTLAPTTENVVARDVTLAQSHTLGDQLRGGIRYFDWRITHRDGQYRAYHGLIGDPVGAMIDDIRSFMESVSMEFAVIEVSHLRIGTHEKNDNRSFNKSEHDGLMSLLVAGLGDYLYRSNGMSVDEFLNTPLRELTADGPRVVLIYDGNGYLEDNLDHPLADYFWAPVLFSGGYTNTTSLYVQVNGNDGLKGQRQRFDEYLAGSQQKLFKLYQTLTADTGLTAKNAVLDLIHGSDYRPTLHGLSQDPNQHLSTFIDDGAPDFPNLVLVDFYEESDVVARAIEISAMCNETAITGSLWVDVPSAWPPNHSMVDVTVDVSGLESQNPESFDAYISNIEVEEPGRKSGQNIYGLNNFEPDWEITGDLTARVRSERDGRAEDRYYILTVSASDCSGDYDFHTTVKVPHDQG